MFEDLITQAEEIIQADQERAHWAEWWAWCEMVQDLAKVANEPVAYYRWCKAVDLKAEEIFARLN